MVAIHNIRNDVHNRTLNFRALDRLVNSADFEEAFKIDSNNQAVRNALIEGDVLFIEKWIDQTLTREIGELSIRKLRLLASELEIPYYSSLTRIELIQKILKVKNDIRIEENAFRVSCQSRG